MKAPFRYFTLAGITLVLLLAFSNCGEVNFQNSTRVGNPGDPPTPTAEVRVEKVNQFLNQICSQQVTVGISNNLSACITEAAKDSALAEKLYHDAVGFADLLDLQKSLSAVSESSANQCLSSISSSEIKIGPSAVYSAATADAVFESIAACDQFFPVLAPLGSCLTTDSTQDGTAAKPWRISTCECFQAIQDNSAVKAHFFRLQNDLNCTAVSAQNNGQGFRGISDLVGSLDGGGFKIIDLSVRPQGDANAAVFYGLLGSVSNLTFEKLALSTTFPGRVATLHLTTRNVSGSETTFNDVHIAAGSFSADMTGGYSFGFTNFLVGSIVNSSFSGTLSGNYAVGLVDENSALRTESAASSQFSSITNSSFSGVLNGRQLLAGLVRDNLGVIETSQATITTNVTHQDAAFTFGGIAIRNMADGLIDQCSVSGDVTLNYNIVTNNSAQYFSTSGTLTTFGAPITTANPAYSNLGGRFTSNNSSLNYTINVTRGAGVSNTISVTYANLLTNGDLGPGNTFTGTANVTIP